jgi:hypothetical protein
VGTTVPHENRFTHPCVGTLPSSANNMGSLLRPSALTSMAQTSPSVAPAGLPPASRHAVCASAIATRSGVGQRKRSAPSPRSSAATQCAGETLVSLVARTG